MKATHTALIAHLLRHLDYHNKNKELLSLDYDLVYPATPENLKEKLY